MCEFGKTIFNFFFLRRRTETFSMSLIRTFYLSLLCQWRCHRRDSHYRKKSIKGKTRIAIVEKFYFLLYLFIWAVIKSNKWNSSSLYVACFFFFIKSIRCNICLQHENDTEKLLSNIFMWILWLIYEQFARIMLL